MAANEALRNVYAELCDSVSRHEEEPNEETFALVKGALSSLGIAIDSLPELEASQLKFVVDYFVLRCMCRGANFSI